jgi:glycosyltransferase involved in cell wall biosynthesis
VSWRAPEAAQQVDRGASVPATVVLLYGSPLHVGGVEAHLLSLLRHGDSEQYRWVVAAPTSPEFRAEAGALGAEVVYWRPRHWLDVGAFCRLLALLKAQAADLVHVHSPRAQLYGLLAARLLRLPALVTVHGPSYYLITGAGRRARFQRWLYQRVEKALNHLLTDRLIYVSPQVRNEAASLGLCPPNRTTVIENGIDLARYARRGQRDAVRARLQTPPDIPLVCSVSRLDRLKSADVFVDAVAHLASGAEPFRVWIVGDGPERPALAAQAARLGGAAIVQFLGFRQDVPDLLGSSDVFVLHSRSEAMSMSILEAMAAGLPCVVTDVGENGHLVVHGKTGYVVPPGDPKRLAAALAVLLGDPALRQAMGAAGRQKVETFDDRRMVERIQAVYASLVDSAKFPVTAFRGAGPGA